MVYPLFSNDVSLATDPALRRLVSSFPQFRSPAVPVSGAFPGRLLHEVSTDSLFVACDSMQAVKFPYGGDRTRRWSQRFFRCAASSLRDRLPNARKRGRSRGPGARRVDAMAVHRSQGSPGRTRLSGYDHDTI